MDYTFTRRDELRSGKQTLVDSLEQKTETHLVSVSTQFGITNKYSIAASVPFIINRSMNKSLDRNENDFGDLSLFLQSFYSPRIFSKPTNLQFAFGATFPIGNGVTNVITDERNFASGTVDLLGSATIAMGLKPDWSFTGKVFTRQVLAKSSNGDKTGNYIESSIEVNYAPLSKKYSMYSGISFINREQDETNSILFANSGGDWLNLKLGGTTTIVGEGESAIILWSEFQFPVYQYVRGTQLTEKWNLRIGFRSGFSLFDHGRNSDTTLKLE